MTAPVGLRKKCKQIKWTHIEKNNKIPLLCNERNVVSEKEITLYIRKTRKAKMHFLFQFLNLKRKLSISVNIHACAAGIFKNANTGLPRLERSSEYRHF